MACRIYGGREVELLKKVLESGELGVILKMEK